MDDRIALNNVRTIKLRELLENNGFEDLASQIKEVQDRKKIIIGDLHKMLYCKHHQWSKITRDVFRKYITYSEDIKTDGERLNKLCQVANGECKCKLCSLPYRYRNIDLEKIIKDVEESFDDGFGMYISFGGNDHSLLSSYFKENINVNELELYALIDSLSYKKRQLLLAEADNVEEIAMIDAKIDELANELDSYHPDLEFLIDEDSFEVKKKRKKRVQS